MGSTAGNSMTSSERPSPEPLPKKEAPPAVLGGDSSGNELEASNALFYRVWGMPAVLSTGIPGNALRAFPGSFRNVSGISSGKCQPHWGYGANKNARVHWVMLLWQTLLQRRQSNTTFLGCHTKGVMQQHAFLEGFLEDFLKVGVA